MKLLRRALLGILLIVFLAFGWIWLNRPQRTDMSDSAPASALVYLESNSLMEVADGIAATDTWKLVKPLTGEAKTDWPSVQMRRLIAFTGIGPTSSVILARAQVAIVMLDLGSREEIAHIYTILERGTSADEQLQVWRDTGDLKIVVDRLIEATMENVPCEVIPGALTAVP